MPQNKFTASLAGLTTEFTPVIDAGLSIADYVHVDLSVANPNLSGQQLQSSADFERWISNYLKAQNKKIAYGGYNEKRGLYRRSDLFSKAENEENIRNIHLGLDLWAPQGTPVYAVLDGVVHSFRDNAAFGDYGPTIILEHRWAEGKFYTLYGHLSRSSLSGIEVDQKIFKGAKIAEFGGAAENGDYAPHLHFQIIRDLEGRSGDYPGVSSRLYLQEQLENCPDPNLILKITRPIA